MRVPAVPERRIGVRAPVRLARPDQDDPVDVIERKPQSRCAGDKSARSGLRGLIAKLVDVIPTSANPGSYVSSLIRRTELKKLVSIRGYVWLRRWLTVGSADALDHQQPIAGCRRQGMRCRAHNARNPDYIKMSCEGGIHMGTRLYISHGSAYVGAARH